jgi:hypothetical protein
VTNAFALLGLLMVSEQDKEIVNRPGESETKFVT